ncbi:MAG: riboflavin synthase [Abditibacteriota bacterium]|nr:riboflavin synthase [Abditibacteriota bacterium]
MFTGLIERVGAIVEVEEENGGRRLVIDCGDADYLADAVIGESIAVGGTCLTAVALQGNTFTAQAVEETLRRTTLGQKQLGDRVNLERALRANARLGGHIVQGHVDGVATIESIREEGDSWWVTFEPPFELLRYIVEKGSICIEGVSLTVANVSYRKFSIALIPHTNQATTASDWRAGALVNIETDVLAKYVERLTQFAAGAEF